MTAVTVESSKQPKQDTERLELWTVRVSDLAELSNPMDDDVWGCGPIDIEEVLSCDDLSIATLPAGKRENATWADDIFSREYNIARIAWLARNGWDDTKDPITIDVYPSAMHEWPAITDGNHRFSAALVNGMETVRICPFGDIDFLMDALKPSKIEFIAASA